MENKKEKIEFEVDGYKLSGDLEKGKFFINFTNYENENILSEIPFETFLLYLEVKKIEKKKENEESRHWEQKSLTENEIYNRAFYCKKSIEDEIIEKDENEKLYLAIKMLPKNQKEKILKYYFKEKNVIEISKEDNVTKQAVAMTLKVSYKNLKKFLKKF